MRTGGDPGEIRELLATAQGYAVFDRSGTRIGAFIELVGPGEDRVAIRRESIFVWRRRLLPIANVAKVVPDRRTVVLGVDAQVLADADARSTPITGTSDLAENVPHSSANWQERIEHYIAPSESQADPTPKPSRGDDGAAAERHLLFISTSRGYALVERGGPPPPLGRGIEIPEQAVPFFVAKLGHSPLPNDPRICAYLEPTR